MYSVIHNSVQVRSVIKGGSLTSYMFDVGGDVVDCDVVCGSDEGTSSDVGTDVTCVIGDVGIDGISGGSFADREGSAEGLPDSGGKGLFFGSLPKNTLWAAV